jgi:hypothetical protein
VTRAQRRGVAVGRRFDVGWTTPHEGPRKVRPASPQESTYGSRQGAAMSDQGGTESSRLARLDRSRDVPVLEGAPRHETTSVPPAARRQWSWKKSRLSMLGSIVGTGAVVAASLFAVQAAVASPSPTSLGTNSHLARPQHRAPTPSLQLIPCKSLSGTRPPAGARISGWGPGPRCDPS